MMFMKHFFSLGLFALSQQVPVVFGADSGVVSALNEVSEEGGSSSLRGQATMTTNAAIIDKNHRMLRTPTLTRIRLFVKFGNNNYKTVELFDEESMTIQADESLQWIDIQGNNILHIHFLVGGRGVKRENRSPWNFCENPSECDRLLKEGWNTIRANIYGGATPFGRLTDKLTVDFRVRVRK